MASDGCPMRAERDGDVLWCCPQRRGHSGPCLDLSDPPGGWQHHVPWEWPATLFGPNTKAAGRGLPDPGDSERTVRDRLGASPCGWCGTALSEHTIEEYQGCVCAIYDDPGDKAGRVTEATAPSEETQ